MPANGHVNGAVDAGRRILANGDRWGVEEARLDLSLEVAGRLLGDPQELLEPSGLWSAGPIISWTSGPADANSWNSVQSHHVKLRAGKSVDASADESK